MPPSPASPDQDRSAFTLNAATILIILLFGLFLIVLATSIYKQWSDAQQGARDRAIAASQVVATNARWISELSRQALARMDEAMGADIEANVSTTSQLVRDAVAGLPGNVKAYIVSEDGHTVYSTDPNVKPIDVRDREYFSALVDGASWYVSPLLLSRLDNQQIFVFSKRLERNRQFAGAAIISFDVMLLKEIWESLSFDAVSTVGLVRDDGQLVARYPLAKGPLDLKDYVLFTDYLKKADIGSYPALSPADNVTRIVAYRRVPETRFIALASVSTQHAFAVFKHNTFMTLAFALPTAIALAGAIVWILRLLRNDQVGRRQLADALELNRMLVKDTHHRVKNNLQAIMSMVRMHALPAELKTALQTRVAAMSAVHESLYRVDQFAEVNAATLIPGIVEPLRQGFGHPVAVTYEVEPIILDRDHATPIALLVNEVVTNSIKYAFPNREDASIRVALKRAQDGKLVLTIADDGQGFDPATPSTGLGTRLIRAMLVQLGGTSSYSFDGGTTFEAIIPANAASTPAPAKPSAPLPEIA